MSRERDPLGLSQHWHVDLRLVAELPEDNVVGTRFLINAVFSAVTVGVLLFTGWLFALNHSLRGQITDWEGKISDNRAEVADIKHMQREYAVESAKIDQAFALMKPTFHVAELIGEIGRTRPEQVAIDTIDWSEGGILIRGVVRENSQRATDLLSKYVKQLALDEKIGPIFREIALTSLERGANEGVQLNFEITFRLKIPTPKPP
jgi:hypothetical protein